MALGTPTLLRAAGTSAATVTTASFTPTAGALLVAEYGARIVSADGGEPTISSSPSLTWTQAYAVIRNAGAASGNRQRLACWTATAPSAVATTVTCGSTSAGRSGVAVREITGASATTNADTATAGGGRPTVTLPTAPATTSIVLGASFMQGVATDPPPGFTELSDTLIGGDWTLETVYSAVPPPTAFQWPTSANLAAVAGGIEISAATVGSTGGFTESLTLTDSVSSVGVAVSAGFTEASGVSDSVGTALTPSGTSPENPVGTWSAAAASWKMPTGADSKGINSLTATGVSATTLNGMPAATFAATSIVRKATPTFVSMPAFTIETWVQPTAFGRVLRIGSATLLSGVKVEVNILATGAYQLVRKIGANTQTSVSAAGVAVIGTAQHVVAVFPQADPHALYINGATVDLTAAGANINANLVIASGDEIALGGTDAIIPASGLAWRSGFRAGNYNDGPTDNSKSTEVETWRGRALDINTMFLIGHSSWGAATNNLQRDFLLSAISLGRTSWSLSVPLLVAGDQEKYLEGSTGAYDSYHTTIAGKLAEALGSLPCVIRLGWEANKGSFAWTWEYGGADDGDPPARSVPNTAEYQGYYKAFWNRIALIYKAALPGALLDFCVLRDVNRSLDAWMPSECDIVSADVYNTFSGANSYHVDNPTTFMGSYNTSTGIAKGPKGICDFARAREKLFAVPEWGVTNNSKLASDKANEEGFVRAMFALFTANSDILHHECYFQSQPTIGHNIFNPSGAAEVTYNQNAANAYLDVY
jgi:hypothetical protein